MSTFPLPDDSIDTLIATQLPRWLKTAPVEHLDKLHASLVTQQRLQQRWRDVLRQITPLDLFTEILLIRALQDQAQVTLDVRNCQLHWVTHHHIPSYVAGVPGRVVAHTARQSLLAAALHNFSSTETREDAYAQGSQLLDERGAVLTLQPHAFAEVCRALDVGGQYQAHLRAHLVPDQAMDISPSPSRVEIETLVEDVHRAGMESAMRLAALQGDIDYVTYLQMLRIIARTPVVPSDDSFLRCRDIRLLGKRIIGVVAIEVWADDSPSAALNSVLLWVPDDPHGAFTRHASWTALYEAVGRRMRNPGYTTFFQRFIGEGERAAFGQALRAALAEGASAAVELDGRDFAVEGDLFRHLRKDHLDKILGDAQTLAVPTQVENAAERMARLHFYLDAGLDLLGLASFLVPGLGAIVLGAAAVQVTDEVYEGYEDWHLGDREAALGHLFAVAEIVVSTLVLGAAQPVLDKVIERVGFVDNLIPVRTNAGQLKLCAGDLAGYRRESGELDEGQTAVIDGHLHIGLPQGTYRLREDAVTGERSIRHPTRDNAYAPRLESTRSGGWRHALELPQQWQGAQWLLRRMGGLLAGVTDIEARFLLEITGYDEAQLRRLHLEHAPPPARLLDALARYRLHEQLPALRAEAFNARIESQRPMPQAGEQVLRRDFPGLSARSAREVIDLANQSQLETLIDQQRVPLALAEQARWLLRDSRLDQALAGLRQAQAITVDSERLAVELIQHSAPWPEPVRIEIRLGSAEGEVLVQSGNEAASEVRTLVRTDGGYQAVSPAGVPVPITATEGNLYQALLLCMDPSQKLQVGAGATTAQGLADTLMAKAARDRPLVARLIGQASVGLGFRPPVQLGDGRLGYPLSGRGAGSRQALDTALRHVFPTLTEAQVRDYLLSQRGRAEGLWEHVNQLHQHLSSLRASLESWQSQQGTLARTFRRRRVAEQIRRCWRRKTGEQQDYGYRLALEGERIDHLPTLPEGVEFDHVTHLTLRNMELSEVPSEFLAHFTGVRRLDLSGNQLTSIPAGLERLSQLQELYLGNNRIVMDDEGNRRLTALNRLAVLELDDNPLGREPDVHSLLRLRHLSLRSTGLDAVPVVALDHPRLESVDLRDNRITTLSGPSLTLPHRRLQRLSLHDNPLTAQALEQLGEAGASAERATEAHDTAITAARDLWLTGLSASEAPRRRAQWNSLMQESGSEDFFRFLADLATSRDFLVLGNDLNRRLWDIIDACEQNSQVREALFQQASEPRTCADQTLLLLSSLEVRALVVERTQGRRGLAAARPLLQLGRALYRLDEVNGIAARHIQRLRGLGIMTDDVEVYLAYRTGLARQLGLPGQPGGMHFQRYSGVSAAQLNNARIDVVRSETPATLLASLVEREYWQRYLHETYPARFEVVDQVFHERLEVLEAQVSWTREQTYLERVEHVARDRQAAQLRLVRELTEQALADFRG